MTQKILISSQGTASLYALNQVFTGGFFSPNNIHINNTVLFINKAITQILTKLLIMRVIRVTKEIQINPLLQDK